MGREIKKSGISRLNFYIILIGVFMGLLMVLGHAISHEVLERREQERNALFYDYFQSENIMVLDKLDHNRYEILTENGLFVVELNKDRNQVVKALRKSE